MRPSPQTAEGPPLLVRLVLGFRVGLSGTYPAVHSLLHASLVRSGHEPHRRLIALDHGRERRAWSALAVVATPDGTVVGLSGPGSGQLPVLHLEPGPERPAAVRHQGLPVVARHLL